MSPRPILLLFCALALWPAQRSWAGACGDISKSVAAIRAAIASGDRAAFEAAASQAAKSSDEVAKMMHEFDRMQIMRPGATSDAAKSFNALSKSRSIEGLNVSLKGRHALTVSDNAEAAALVTKRLNSLDNFFEHARHDVSALNDVLMDDSASAEAKSAASAQMKDLLKRAKNLEPEINALKAKEIDFDKYLPLQTPVKGTADTWLGDIRNIADEVANMKNKL